MAKKELLGVTTTEGFDTQLESLMDKYLTEKDQGFELTDTAMQITQLFISNLGIKEEIWKMSIEDFQKIVKETDHTAAPELKGEAAKIAKYLLAQTTGSRMIQDLREEDVIERMNTLINEAKKKTGGVATTLKDLLTQQIKKDLKGVNKRKYQRQAIVGGVLGLAVGFISAAFVVPLIAAACVGFVAGMIGMMTGKEIGFGVGSIISKLFSPKSSRVMLKILEKRRVALQKATEDTGKMIDPYKTNSLFYKIVGAITNEKTVTSLKKSVRTARDHFSDIKQRMGEFKQHFAKIFTAMINGAQEKVLEPMKKASLSIVGKRRQQASIMPS